jgi:thiamine biosynthesis lipoprotein
MTWFSATSDVGRANHGAARDGVAITRATAAVIEESLVWAHASDGAFDPCLGKAMGLWDVTTRRVPPPRDQVRRLAGRALYTSLDVSDVRGRPAVRFTDQDVQVDLGGIAKGYGVDRAVQELREWDIDRAIVNVGGDLYAMGESEDGDPWSVGVRSPLDPGKIVEQFTVADEAVATSGDYLRYFQHQGRRYHHLLNPATGAPRRASLHSTTVAASTCMRADAAATTVFGMESGTAGKLLTAQAPGARIVSRV